VHDHERCGNARQRDREGRSLRPQPLDALTRFVQDGRVGLDTNIAELQLRSIALGRRNYLFARSHAGGAPTPARASRLFDVAAPVTQ
jgi:hypothetical protein